MVSVLSNLADKPCFRILPALEPRAGEREPVNKKAAPGISAVGLRIGFG
jgi:hypothetical protein